MSHHNTSFQTRLLQPQTFSATDILAHEVKVLDLCCRHLQRNSLVNITGTVLSKHTGTETWTVQIMLDGNTLLDATWTEADGMEHPFEVTVEIQGPPGQGCSCKHGGVMHHNLNPGKHTPTRDVPGQMDTTQNLGVIFVYQSSVANPAAQKIRLRDLNVTIGNL